MTHRSLWFRSSGSTLRRQEGTEPFVALSGWRMFPVPDIFRNLFGRTTV